MEKGQIEFSITSLELLEILNKMTMFKYFFCINSNCIFSKTIWKNLGSWMETDRIEGTDVTLWQKKDHQKSGEHL